MIPLEEDQDKHRDTGEVCLYDRTASDIKTSKQEPTYKHLGDVVFHHSRPKEQTEHFKTEIQTEVNFFMKRMWNWLNQQA